ncbi:hypothetical protein [Paraburkholderia youngii]|uniref:hypothetical protein n=1 Tax=Paraburkholderia youngii TaxID=2782701 RepID=UPI003D20E835
MKPKQSNQIVVDAPFARQTVASSESSIPCEGRVVFSEVAHPVYEAVFEVRLMRDGSFAIWHHHGDASMAWKDETAPAYAAKQDAISKIREYQSVFCAVSAQRRQDYHAY